MSRSGSRTSTKRAAGVSKRPYIWLVGLVLVAVVATVIMSLTRDDDTSTDAAVSGGVAVAETNDVVIDGAPLPELQNVETATGSPAPQATGTSLDGDTIALLDVGTPTVVGFFAHWCPHCQAEVDELSKHFASTGLPDGVDVIAVSTGVDSTRGNFPPSAWFDSEGWPTQILTDDDASSLAQAYGLSGFPFWAVVDAEGNVVTRSSGGIGTDRFDAFVELARTGS